MRLRLRPAPAAPGRAALALAALAALPLGGCDIVDGFLSQPTQQEIDATAEILGDETGCAAVQVRTAPATASGSLATSDCLSGGAYYDFWLFKASSTTEVALALTSGAFAPYLRLSIVDVQGHAVLGNGGVEDADDDGDGRAAFSQTVSAGLYVVVASSVDEDERGDYTLRVERTAP